VDGCSGIPRNFVGGGGVFLEEMSCRRYDKKEGKEQKERHSYKLLTFVEYCCV